jgi:MoaA/NifB/PqqE/SkfB family radical SAM enzyme
MAAGQLLELARKSFLSNLGDLTFPMKLSFVVTYRCNAKCIMCNIWKKKDVPEFTTDEIDRFFSKSNQFSWMDLSGGEIFLRNDIVDISEIALRRCRNLFLLHFASNGLLTDRIVSSMEKILKLRPPKLLMTVSLDAYPELHDTMRGIPGTFDRAIRTFQELRKMNSPRFKVFLGMTLTEHNYQHVERSFAVFKSIIKDLDYDELHVNIVQKSGHYYDNLGINTPDPHGMQHAVEMIREKRRKRSSVVSPVDYLEHKYQELARVFLDTGTCPLRCQALSVSCFMDPTGNVYPCNMYDNLIGNIRDFDYDLKKLLASPEARKIRKEIKNGVCPQCWTPCEAYQTIIANFFGLRKKTT